LRDEERQALDAVRADHQFHGDRTFPSDLTRAVLQHRPLWLASVLGTPKRIPLDDGLFDLVIFDEASQCDIASALPLFARAKRAVVVGDDRQLSFIPQLGQAQDRNLMKAQGLPTLGMGRFAQSRQSLFDFAKRVPGVPRVLLRHQYRSAGPIVDYISETFYGGQLTTSYDPKTIRPPKDQKPGIAWSHVPGPGIAQQGNVNPAEAEAIAAHIRMLLVDQGYDGSLGVISPFRPQVQTIEAAVRAKVSVQKLEGAEFRVATVDGFQGQERDLILFSHCLSANSAMSAVTFVQKDLRRLNVAISRARAVAHVFGDLDYARSAKVRALARLAAVATEPRRTVGEGVFDSEWERRVFYALKERGLVPQPQFEIAGRRLDFALFGATGVKLDLEVDGRHWHQDTDGRRKMTDHWRDHQLQSLGWRVRRFWVDELSKDMEACLDLIERDLS
jgi:very-short-patch-repair endonuclease